MANQSFAGGLNEGQDGTPIGNFGMGEGQGNQSTNFSAAQPLMTALHTTHQPREIEALMFQSQTLGLVIWYGGYEDDPSV